MFRCAEREKIVNGHSKRRHHQRGAVQASGRDHAGPGTWRGPGRGDLRTLGRRGTPQALKPAAERYRGNLLLGFTVNEPLVERHLPPTFPRPRGRCSGGMSSWGGCSLRFLAFVSGRVRAWTAPLVATAREEELVNARM